MYTSEYLYGTSEYPPTTEEKLQQGVTLLNKLVATKSTDTERLIAIAANVNNNNKILKGGL